MRRAGMHMRPETLFSDSASWDLHAVSSAWSCAALRSLRPGTGSAWVVCCWLLPRAPDCAHWGEVAAAAVLWGS
eukprot:2770546-Amphidinium_carterae.1